MGSPLPEIAAWRHGGARDGFEVVFLGSDPGGLRMEGDTAAVEDGEAWAVHYVIRLREDWTTTSARVTTTSRAGSREIDLQADGAGRWRIGGRPAPWLDGCLDVDLESSALTNAFPVHRLRPAVGERIDAPAAYVRALDLRVERLEQRYARLDDGAGGGPRYDYAAPAFAFECRLSYDADGLVADYPGIATRAV